MAEEVKTIICRKVNHKSSESVSKLQIFVYYFRCLGLKGFAVESDRYFVLSYLLCKHTRNRRELAKMSHVRTQNVLFACE